MGIQIQKNENGAIEKHKAPYVAKGFRQIEGLELFNTFAPTSKPELFTILIHLAAKENLLLTRKISLLTSKKCRKVF